MYYHCHCNEILWNTSIVVHINILLSELYVQYCTYNVLSEVGKHFYISFCCAISIFAFQRIVRTTNCKAVLSHPHHAFADFSRQRMNAASFLEWGGGVLYMPMWKNTKYVLKEQKFAPSPFHNLYLLLRFHRTTRIVWKKRVCPPRLTILYCISLCIK